MSDEKTVDLLEKLVAQGDANRRRSSNAGPLDGGFGILGDAAKTGAGALNDLWRGTLDVSNGLSTFNGLISRHGGELGNVIGKLSQQVGAAILDTTASLNKSGQYGADFGMDIAEYDRLLKGARMTHEQYNDFIKHSASELAGLGSGINKAQKNFLEIARDFQESGIGAKFKELGWSTDELNELTKAAMTNRKGMDMADPEQQRAAVLATQKLGLAMDENARILGLNRKDQMAEISKKNQDARLEATFQSMDPAARAQYTQGEAQTMGMGDSFKRVMKEAFTGKITDEGSEAAAAMGTSAAAIREYGKSLQDTSAEGQKKSQELLEKAKAEYMAWEQTKGFKNMVRYADGGVADKAGQDLITNKTLAVVQTAKAEAATAGKPIDDATALKELSAKATNRQAGLDESGKELDSAGAKVATTVNKLDRTLGDMFAGSHEIFGKLVGKVDDTAGSFKNLNEILKPHTQSQMNPSAIIDRAGEHLKNVPGLKQAYEAGKSAGDMTPEQMAKPVEPVKRAGGSPELTDFLSSTSASFSSMFEHFDPAGVPAELHGNEVVATESQMMKLVQKLVPENFANVSKQTPAPAPVATELKLPQIPSITDKKPDEVKPAEAKVTQTVFSPKFEEELVKTVNATLTNVFTTALAPIKTMAQTKPAEVKPPEVKKPEIKPEVKPVEAKPVEEHHEKVQAVMKNIESIHKDTIANKPTAADNKKIDEWFIKNAPQATKPVIPPAPKLEKPKAPDVSQLDSSLLNLAKFKQAVNSGDISKMGMTQMDLSETGIAAEKKLAPGKDRADLQKKREALENAAFDYEQMKAANTKPTLESAERLAKKKEELAKISSDYEDSLIKTKGRLKLHAEKEAEHAEVKNKQAQDAHALQVKQALAQEQKFMKEHGPESAKKVEEAPKPEVDLSKVPGAKYLDATDKLKSQAASVLDSVKTTFKSDKPETPKVEPEKPKEEPSFFDSVTSTFSNIGSSIADVFKEDNRPAFAKGNVKYETIPPEELAAMEKRSQEGIGKVDNSPEAIAARNAELDRQKNSGLYKQKEPEKAPVADIKKPVELTKEQAHIKEMYKKFGLESFSDYNTRLDAEEKAKKPQLAKVAEVKTPLPPTIKQPDLKPPTLTSGEVKQPTPPPVATHVEEKKPVEQPKPAPAVVEKQVTLKDILDAVTKLNTVMTQMAHHTDKISSNSHKQIRATEGLSNSRF